MSRIRRFALTHDDDLWEDYEGQYREVEDDREDDSQPPSEPWPFENLAEREAFEAFHAVLTLI